MDWHWPEMRGIEIPRRLPQLHPPHPLLSAIQKRKQPTAPIPISIDEARLPSSVEIRGGHRPQWKDQNRDGEVGFRYRPGCVFDRPGRTLGNAFVGKRPTIPHEVRQAIDKLKVNRWPNLGFPRVTGSTQQPAQGPQRQTTRQERKKVECRQAK